MRKNTFFISMQKVLPQALLSRIAGMLANTKQSSVKNFLIKLAIKRFGIDLSEAIRQSPDDYQSFNDFFTRKLKPEARLIDQDKNTITSPADGEMTQCGKIHDKQLIQAKGKGFSVDHLTAQSSTTSFTDFATIYLSPKDYHRVHMPMDGRLTKMVYIPGRLFSVNALTSQHIDALFAKNERLVCYFETSIGEIAVIFVGAMLVAGIVTSWHKMVTPNYMKTIESWDYSQQNICFAKGEEIGYFNFGSTIICLFPDNHATCINQEKHVQMGQIIAKIS